MQAKRDQRHAVTGIPGPTGDLNSTSDHYQRAVEAALDGYINSVVIERADQAEEAIRFLNHGKAGRVTFLPLDTIQRSADRRNADHTDPALTGHPGVIAPLLDLIESDDRLRPVISSLLRTSAPAETRLGYTLPISAGIVMGTLGSGPKSKRVNRRRGTGSFTPGIVSRVTAVRSGVTAVPSSILGWRLGGGASPLLTQRSMLTREARIRAR